MRARRCAPTSRSKAYCGVPWLAPASSRGTFTFAARRTAATPRRRALREGDDRVVSGEDPCRQRLQDRLDEADFELMLEHGKWS